MSCGCGKSKRPSRMQRLAAQRAVELRYKARKVAKIRKTGVPQSSLSQRVVICSACPASSQTKNERKRGLKVCHKTNRLINNLIKDKKFKCPIGKW